MLKKVYFLVYFETVLNFILNEILMFISSGLNRGQIQFIMRKTVLIVPAFEEEPKLPYTNNAGIIPNIVGPIIHKTVIFLLEHIL